MDDINFPDNTTPGQLTLLAGNCMSVPVIGAMIMGLLVTADFEGRLSQFRQYVPGVPPMMINKHIVVKGSTMWVRRLAMLDRQVRPKGKAKAKAKAKGMDSSSASSTSSNTPSTSSSTQSTSD